MRYEVIQPAARLRSYVKCYYIYESDVSAAFEDVVFPSGNMELIFNLGSGHWQAGSDGAFITTPPIEVWGQIIKPLAVRSVGRNTMLGVRFFPHAAVCFLPEKIDLLNNLVVDARELAGPEVESLHGRLLDTMDWEERIGLLQAFLLRRLAVRSGGVERMDMVGDVMRELRRPDHFENIEHVAGRYGISSRYLQKLFLQYTGLTPKLYSKIHRFQQSLSLIGKKEFSLTSIAYDCGYFDQSHFIREFKSFTGHTPSSYVLAASPVTEALVSSPGTGELVA